MPEIVKVALTHSASTSVIPEKRYSLQQTVESVKQSLYSYFGTPSHQIRLELFDRAGAKLESDMKDEKMLGYYQVKDEYRIHAIDLQPTAQIVNYNDVSQVQKFEIPEEKWLQREDNARAFKMRMLQEQAKSQGETERISMNSSPTLDDNSYSTLAEKISVGDRCLCQPGDRLGTVRYVGCIAGLKSGFWVGVEFDEPVGKSDGSVKGQKLFECRPQYGGFLRPDQVSTGDYPPEEF